MTDVARDRGYAIDPELADLAALMADTPPLTDAVEARDRITSFIGDLNANVDVSSLAVDDREIQGPTGAPPVPVRVYAPAERDGTPVPAILYIHGGGFFSGSIETEHSGAAGLARDLGVVVVSVEYRLAPEHPYPAGLDDCYAALQWLAASADEFGVDRARIAVNGGSAGGGLAAAVALVARDRGGPQLCFQYLGIPELDDRLETPSMRQFVDTPVWARPSAVKSWEWYLGDLDGEVPPYAAPARATDLAGLPRAYVSVMEFDPLRDEGIDYATRMLAAGVPVELHCFPGTFHGSAVIATAAVHRREHAERMAVWRHALRLG